MSGAGCRARSWGRSIVAIATLCTGANAAAQVATDGTAGPRLDLAGPDYAIGADLGTRAGGNLFHSFESFSIGTGESATFSGPADIDNVISRVTGGARSDIDGTLRSTITGADFFFLNPAGVLFGPNASLQVGGSFHVSTADQLLFDNGDVFSAKNPAASSFSVAAPEAFGFLGAGASTLTVDGSELRLPTFGPSLSLTGGEVVIENGSDIVANNILIATESSTGAIDLATASPSESRSGRVTIGSSDAGAPVRVASFGLIGGHTRVETGELRIVNGIVGDVHVGPFASVGAVDIAADRVTIRNDELVAGTSIGVLTASQSFGRASAVRVVASELDVVGGLIVSAATAADAGPITIEADRIHISGGTNSVGAVGSPTGVFGSGASSGIVVTVDQSLIISAGGQINTVSLGDQSAGSITIDLGEGASFVMEPGSLIEATARGQGQGGDVTIRGGDVSLAGAVVSAETFAGGAGGTIDIDTGALLIDDSFVGANSRELATGDAGPVFVHADSIEIRNEGRIFNGTNGFGNGGDVTVTTGTLLIDGALDHAGMFNTGISAGAQVDSSGRSGDVSVSATGEIMLRNQGEIASGTLGDGAAGDVTVSGHSVVLLQGGRIVSSSRGPKQAGAIDLRATDELRTDGGIIATDSSSSGGGQVTIRVGHLIDLLASEVTTSVNSDASATAGDITIDPEFLVVDGSRIVANAAGGTGGNIVIVVDNLLVSPDSTIEASGAISGTVDIVSQEDTVTDRLVGLNVQPFDVSSLLGERCAARRNVGASSFTGVGRAGLPPSPDGPLTGGYAGARSDAGAPATLPGADRTRLVMAPTRVPEVEIALVLPCAGAL